MSKTITRKYIQRITKREGDTSIRRNSGGGGGGGGVSQYWVDDNYVSKEFFNRLFEIHDENGDPILPNDVETEIDNIQAMFGFWTNAYLSALGQNDEGGGAELTLASLADVAVQGVTDGQALVWNAAQGKWVPGQGGGGLDPTAMWAELATTTTQQISKTHLTTALADYLPLTGGTMTGTIYRKMSRDTSNAENAIVYVNTSGTPIATMGYHNTEQRLIFNAIGATSVWSDSVGKYSFIVGNNELKYNTYDVWYAGNDGSGSGLDADLLDGHHATDFALASAISDMATQTWVSTNYLSKTDAASTYLTKTEANTTYLSISFFRALFRAYTSGGSEVVPNGGSTSTIDNIKAMFGFWTNSYLSALGNNPGGASLTLSSLSDVSISGATAGQVLTYRNGTWRNETPQGGGLDPTAMWAELANTGTEQINASHLTNALAGYNPTSNFKTINGNSIIGTGDIAVSAGTGTVTSIVTGGTTYSPTNGVVTLPDNIVYTNENSGYLSARFLKAEYSQKAAQKYIEFWGSTGGWFNFMLGTLYATSDVKVGSNSVIHTGNIGSQSVNYATSASKLETARTIWGQSFDGTANVSGDMTGVGTISASGDNTITKSSTDDAKFAANNNNGTIELLASYNRGIYDRTQSRWLIATNGTNSWLPAGNVGIGTTSPSYKLHVEGTGYYSSNLLVQSIDIGNTCEINSTDGHGLYLQYRNSGALILCHNGANCGVGADNPSYKLHVGGTFYASGNSSIGGTFGVTGATTLSSTLGVTGNTTLSGTLSVSKATTLSSTLGVTGETTLSSTLGVTGLLTASGGITIPSGKTLTIGDAVLSWDSTNQGIKITKGLYSETFISALGKGNGGSSGISIETVWNALANSDSSKQISISHLTNALSGYNPTSNFKTINGNSIIGTGDIAISAGTGTVTSIVTGGTTYSPTNGVVTLPDNIIYTIDDNVNYVNASFLKSDFSKKAAQKYIEFWDSAGGWFNFMLGTLYVVNNVGIGTTSPSYKLHVSGICAVDEGLYKRNADSHPLSLWRATDSNQKLDIYVHDVLAVLNASDSDGWSSFSFCTNGTEYVRFDGHNKYVGIGTTSPAYKLDVNGDVRADNFIGNFANKTVTASTLDGLAGSFTFEGNELTTSGYDEVGIQIGSSVDKFQIIGKSGTLLIRQNDNGGTSTSDWTAWTMLPTKVYTRHLLTKTDQWYRVANLTTFGMSYIISIRESYINREPTPATFIINTSYTNATITQIGRASATPNSITKVRLVKYGNGTFHVEVYTPKLSGSSSASMNTPEVNIFNLGRENTSDGIAIVHDPNDDTKWLEVDENIASGETLIEEATISTETTASALLNARSLWGQSFDGTANISGNMTGVGTISASGNNTITKTSEDATFAAVNNNGRIELLTSSNRGVYDGTQSRWLIATNGTNSWLPAGNVGIGTTSPAYKLDVNGDVRADNFRGNFVGNADSATKLKTARTIWGQSFDGTANVSGSITNATTITASSNVSVGGTLGVTGATTLSSTLSVSSTSTLTGNVGIGTTPHSKYVLRANGEVYVSTGLTSHGYVTALSDIRHKDIHGDVGLTVSEVANAPAVKFLWKDRRQEGLQVGSIAQYWQKVLPEAIVEAADGELTMSYGVIALLASIANAREIVNLKREIAELKRKLQKHGILE